MKPEVRLVELMKDIVAKVSIKLLAQLQAYDPTITGVYYKYGHLLDIRERLRAETLADPSQRRYPLIWLIEDFRTTQQLGLFGVSSARIMILHQTKKEYTRQQREDEVFQPVLVPIYNELFNQMKISGLFMQYGPFSHDRIERPHYGNPSEWRNEAYLFDEPLDGIEIANLSLQIYFSNCVTA